MGLEQEQVMVVREVADFSAGARWKIRTLTER